MKAFIIIASIALCAGSVLAGQASLLKRNPEALTVATNADGSLSPEALEALERWGAQFGGNADTTKRNAKPLMVAANPDGSFSPESKEALRQWEAQFGGGSSTKKRDALVLENALSPEDQADLERWWNGGQKKRAVSFSA